LAAAKATRRPCCFWSQIAKENILPETVVAIIERHVGGGITEQEAKESTGPPSNYIPVTLEEKIVSYADKTGGNFKPHNPHRIHGGKSFGNKN
jgi:hypothetical protein